MNGRRQPTGLIPAVKVHRLAPGVYAARGGRWRLVRYLGGWLVGDGWGRFNDGVAVHARTLSDGRRTIGAAERCAS